MTGEGTWSSSRLLATERLRAQGDLPSLVVTFMVVNQMLGAPWTTGWNSSLEPWRVRLPDTSDSQYPHQPLVLVLQVTHELFHSLGLIHEHTRPDRYLEGVRMPRLLGVRELVQ